MGPGQFNRMGILSCCRLLFPPSLPSAPGRAARSGRPVGPLPLRAGGAPAFPKEELVVHHAYSCIFLFGRTDQISAARAILVGARISIQ